MKLPSGLKKKLPSANGLGKKTKLVKSNLRVPESCPKQKTIWTVLLVIQCIGLFLLFVGSCGVSSADEFAPSKGWLWWTLLLHSFVMAWGLLYHIRPHLELPVGAVHMLMTAAWSVVSLTILADKASFASGVTVGALASYYRLALAACIVLLLSFVPLLVLVSSSVEGLSPARRTGSSKISLPRTSDGKANTTTSDLRFVELSAAEKGMGPQSSEVLDNGDYKSYSNPYAQDKRATTSQAGIESIQPALTVQAGYPPPPSDLPPSPRVNVSLSSAARQALPITAVPQHQQGADLSQTSVSLRACASDMPSDDTAAKMPTAQMPTASGTDTTAINVAKSIELTAVSSPLLPLDATSKSSILDPADGGQPKDAPPLAALLHASKQPLAVQVDGQVSPDFVTPKGVSSTINGDDTPRDSPHQPIEAAAPDFLNEGESEPESEDGADDSRRRAGW